MLSAAKKSWECYNAMKSKWTNDVAIRAIASKCPCYKQVRLELDWICENRRHDPDNVQAAVKFIWDGLKVAKVIPNDGWAVNKGTTHLHPRIGDRAGVYVKIIDASEGEKCNDMSKDSSRQPTTPRRKGKSVTFSGSSSIARQVQNTQAGPSRRPSVSPAYSQLSDEEYLADLRRRLAVTT